MLRWEREILAVLKISLQQHASSDCAPSRPHVDLTSVHSKKNIAAHPSFLVLIGVAEKERASERGRRRQSVDRRFISRRGVHIITRASLTRPRHRAAQPEIVGADRLI